MSLLDKARQSINEIDREMVRLFEQRMDAVQQVATYKKEHGIPIEDTNREECIIQKNIAYIENKDYCSHYVNFLRSTMQVSKNYQYDLLNGLNDTKDFELEKIYIKRGLLQYAGELFNLDRKVLIVTDTGVPEDYAMTVASQCSEAVVFVFEQGEASKNISTYTSLIETLIENTFTRTDCVVAVGGGVVGDMAGFAAATYMRGIDFYNVPTTLLSQVDASIGGKTAIDFKGYKNLVGAFYPPKGVLIDPQVLNTLPDRQISNGLAEVVKVALTHDSTLFSLLENTPLTDATMDEIIQRAISIKKQIVALDERESGLRKVLNFGHTLGHGIESITNLYHGECVAIGMLPMCSEPVKQRLCPLLERLGLPTTASCDIEAVIEACRHDKKSDGNTFTAITVQEIGSYQMKTMDLPDLETLAREVLNG